MRGCDGQGKLAKSDSFEEPPAVPTLTRLILVLIILGGLGYGAVYSLANLVEPREREITVRIKKDGFGR
ncbi:hypothetical protein DYI23_17340 [Roseibium polysiphoniae]|uniref:Uncharacterized protein n=1 Tax=Roseibium polysiphoniae TaxID=2571221 RepID=A0A944GUU5_9HYPH|nr:hypothetical protein [Roseibium polysiphoniae]